MAAPNTKEQAVRTIETIGGQGLVPTIAPIDQLEEEKDTGRGEKTEHPI